MKLIKWIVGLFKPKARRMFTSDLHFGHRNVINYCDRPWKDKDEMNEGLVKLWNEQVNPQDEVWVLGDFSLSPKMVLQFVNRLNGKKKIVLGNHDAPFEFDRRPKAAKMREKYLKDFETVEMDGELTLKNGVKVLLKHFPYSLDYDQRYRQHRMEDKGEWLLHGHLHGKYVKSGKQIDVGVDASFKIYSEDDIIAIMNDPRDFIPTRLTGKVQEKRNNMKGQDDDSY
jgi:calcineurin-like phosphoesterase family protein